MQASMPTGEAKQDLETLVSAPGDIELLYIGADGPDKVCEALGQCRQRGIPACILTYLQVKLCSSTPLFFCEALHKVTVCSRSKVCSQVQENVPKIELERALCLLEPLMQYCLREHHCSHLKSRM